MKKALLLAFSFIASVTLSAQSLAIAAMDTVLEVNSTGVADYGFSVDIRNISSAPIDVKAARAYSSPSCAFDSSYFCWDYCYASYADTSIGALTIQPNDVRTDFSGHVYSPTTGADCVDSTRYVFFIDEGKNTTDTISVWVTISAGPTVGTVEISVRPVDVYPNPAKNYVTVETDRSGEFRLYNALGAMMISKTLHPGKNTVPTHMLSNGVYLYSVDNGQVKKLIVNH